jgi:hypothetical protein
MTAIVLVIPDRDNKNLKFGLSCLPPTTDLFLALPASSSLKALLRTSGRAPLVLELQPQPHLQYLIVGSFGIEKKDENSKKLLVFC